MDDMDDVDGQGREKLTSGGKCEGTFLDNHDFLGFRRMAWSSSQDGRSLI